MASKNFLDNKLFLYSQRIFSLNSSYNYVYFEFLSRFYDNKNKKFISSEKIFNNLPDEDLLLLDIEIFKNAFNSLSNYSKFFKKNYVAFLNVSRGSIIYYNDFLKKLNKLQRIYSIPSKNMLLEVTENCNKNVSFFLERCLNEGYQVALDDIGKGFFNINNLKKYVFNVIFEFPYKDFFIKIDKSYTKDFFKYTDFFNLAKNVKLSYSSINLVAEGIENKLVLDSLKYYNIDFGQGFYLEKPQEFNFNYINKHFIKS